MAYISKMILGSKQISTAKETLDNEKLRIRLNSAQFELKLLVGAELGNDTNCIEPSFQFFSNKTLLINCICASSYYFIT